MDLIGGLMSRERMPTRASGGKFAEEVVTRTGRAFGFISRHSRLVWSSIWLPSSGEHASLFSLIHYLSLLQDDFSSY